MNKIGIKKKVCINQVLFSQSLLSQDEQRKFLQTVTMELHCIFLESPLEFLTKLPPFVGLARVGSLSLLK